MAQSITCSGQIGSKGTRLIARVRNPTAATPPVSWSPEKGGGRRRSVPAAFSVENKVRAGAGGGDEPSGMIGESVRLVAPKSKLIGPPDPTPPDIAHVTAIQLTGSQSAPRPTPSGYSPIEGESLRARR
jgi:hypothetical protein